MKLAKLIFRRLVLAVLKALSLGQFALGRVGFEQRPARSRRVSLSLVSHRQAE